MVTCFYLTVKILYRISYAFVLLCLVENSSNPVVLLLSPKIDSQSNSQSSYLSLLSDGQASSPSLVPSQYPTAMCFDPFFLAPWSCPAALGAEGAPWSTHFHPYCHPRDLVAEVSGEGEGLPRAQGSGSEVLFAGPLGNCTVCPCQPVTLHCLWLPFGCRSSP